MDRLLRVVPVVVALLPLGAGARDRTTVAAAPLTTTSGPEYQWIGPAIAGALSFRVYQQPELNTVTLRQVNAAMRNDNVQPEEVVGLEAATRLGRQLGANVILVGSYNAAWPDIEMAIKIIDPRAGKVLGTHLISGGLDDLLDLEARCAQALATELGADKPDVAPGAFGTSKMRAWRSATLGLQIINWQSLGPAAADAKIPPKLSTPAVEKARKYFAEATRYDPDYGEAWAGLGVAQALLGDTESARRALRKATAVGSGHHPTAVLGASFLSMREGKLDEAAQILASAVGRHPGFLHARGYLGELYIHRGQYQKALEVFDAYAKIVPEQPWVLVQRGYAKSKLTDHVGAIADTIAAVDLLPDSPSLLLQLASRYIDARKLIGAEDALQHALKSHPQEPTIYVRLGYVYLLQGKDDLVIPITEKALLLASFVKRRRDLAYAHLNLARAYGHKGDLDRAFEHLKEVKTIGAPLAEVEADPKLTDLRKDTRYRKLVK